MTSSRYASRPHKDEYSELVSARSDKTYYHISEIHPFLRRLLERIPTFEFVAVPLQRSLARFGYLNLLHGKEVLG